MNPFEEYFKLERILKRHPLLKDVFKNMVEKKKYKNINTRVLYDDLEPNKTMGKYIWKFSESLKECIESGQDIIPPEKFDENTFFTVLFVTLCDEEIPPEESSGSLQVLNVLIQYCNWKKDDKIVKKDTFGFTFSICLGRIHQRHIKRLSVPSNLMLNLYEFIKNTNLTVRSLQRVVKYMVGITVTYYSPLTDLKYFDENTAVGKLAFLILSNMISRHYAAEPTRQKMVQMIFSVMEAKTSSMGLCENDKSIIEANYRSLILQSVPNVSNHNPLIYAIVNIIKAKPQNKSLIKLICNLPYKIYHEIVQLLYKLARRTYNHPTQIVLYRILQIPYKTQTADEKSIQFQLILKMTESIFWSMKLECRTARIRTIQLIHCVLRLPDCETIDALKTILNDNVYFSAYKLLNFSFEHTNLKWETNYKGINQYFLCIFCNILIIRGKQYENNVRQFRIILEAADSTDLLPCISILLRTYKHFIKIYPDVTTPIITVFCYHAVSPNSTCVYYLEAIYSLTLGINNHFVSIPTGEMLDLILKNIDYKNMIWKKLVSYNLITSTTVKKLFEGLLSGYNNTWKLLSRILPNMPNEILPSAILCHWKKIRNDNQWTNKDIIHIFNTIGLLVELKIYFKDHERAFFNDVYQYICKSLEERVIPTTYISVVLMTATKIIKALKLSLTLLLKVYINIENDLSVGLQLFKPSILFKYNKSFLRVAMYFREMNLVFSYCITPSVYIFKLVSYILNNLDDYDSRNEEIISHVLRIAVQIGIKYRQLRELTIFTMKMLIPEADFALKSTILYCFYDIATLQSGSYDGMIPILYEFFFLDNWELQYQAAKVLLGLTNTNQYIPNSWEIHILMNIACQRNVFKFFNEDFSRTFLIKCQNILAENFINIILYFHKLYDIKNYELNHVQKRHMPRREVNMEKRKFLYQFILLQFSQKLKMQIINNIFDVIVDKFHTLPLEFPNNYELLQDVIYVTFQATKNPAFSFPKNNKDLYEQSICDIQKLTVFTAIKKDIRQDEEEDVIIKRIMTGIFKLFDKLDTNGRVVIPELFHLMLCVFNGYYDKIFNMLVDEGPNGSFRKCIHRIPAYFTIYKHLLHMEISINLEDPLSKLISE